MRRREPIWIIIAAAVTVFLLFLLGGGIMARGTMGPWMWGATAPSWWIGLVVLWLAYIAGFGFLVAWLMRRALDPPE